MLRSTPSPTTTTYAYNGDGLRTSKTSGGNTTTYTWDVNAGLPVILQDGTYTYVYGLGLISQTDGAGVQTYVMGDGLSSTTDLVNISGTVTATYGYDVFGAIRSQTGTGSTEYRFNAQQADGTGLMYLRARYGACPEASRRDPATGRFLGRDPLPGMMGSPQSQNRYGYANNTPTTFTDPSGESICTPAGVLAVASMLAYQFELWQALDSYGPEWASFVAKWAPRAIEYYSTVCGFGPTMKALKGVGAMSRLARMERGVGNHAVRKVTVPQEAIVKPGTSAAALKERLRTAGWTEGPTDRNDGLIFSDPRTGTTVRVMDKGYRQDPSRPYARVRNRGGGQVDSDGHQTDDMDAAHIPLDP